MGQVWSKCYTQMSVPCSWLFLYKYIDVPRTKSLSQLFHPTLMLLTREAAQPAKAKAERNWDEGQKGHLSQHNLTLSQGRKRGKSWIVKVPLPSAGLPQALRLRSCLLSGLWGLGGDLLTEFRQPGQHELVYIFLLRIFILIVYACRRFFFLPLFISFCLVRASIPLISAFTQIFSDIPLIWHL